MKIEKRALVSLTNKERNEVRSISVNGDYGMRDLLREIKKNPDLYGKAEIFLLYHKKKLIAWSAIAPIEYTYSRQLEIWVYVKRDYRRKGIGTILYKAAKRRINRIKKENAVSPWNNIGYKFFRSQGIKV